MALALLWEDESQQTHARVYTVAESAGSRLVNKQKTNSYNF
jgi:hypothetical protein